MLAHDLWLFRGSSDLHFHVWDELLIFMNSNVPVDFLLKSKNSLLNSLFLQDFLHYYFKNVEYFCILYCLYLESI